MIKGKLAYLNRLYSRVQFKPLVLSKHMEGSSPPSVFIGRIGYPRVYVGPLLPPVRGDTALMDTPEAWLSSLSNETIEKQAEIINFRMQLVRGKTAVRVNDRGKTVEILQSVALAKKSIDIEADFSKTPQGRFIHEEMQPFGPSAPIKDLKIDATKWEPKLEKAHNDTDLLSRDAVIDLYNHNTLVSTIQKAFSTGAFGLDKNRKLVPTRWSITAVDDMLGLHLLDKVKQYDTINEYRVYEVENINNKFVIIFLPTKWQYETMEAWFPQIIGDHLEIYSDWEGFEKKKNYALIGGCYYAARLAVAEKLERERKQAGIIILRESYPGYIPLGVWNVRQCVREALNKQPTAFDNFESALLYAKTLLKISMYQWIKQSNILKKLIQEKKLTQFAR